MKNCRIRTNIVRKSSRLTRQTPSCARVELRAAETQVAWNCLMWSLAEWTSLCWSWPPLARSSCQCKPMETKQCAWHEYLIVARSLCTDLSHFSLPVAPAEISPCPAKWQAALSWSRCSRRLPVPSWQQPVWGGKEGRSGVAECRGISSKGYPRWSSSHCSSSTP